MYNFVPWQLVCLIATLCNHVPHSITFNSTLFNLGQSNSCSCILILPSNDLLWFPITPIISYQFTFPSSLTIHVLALTEHVHIYITLMLCVCDCCDCLCLLHLIHCDDYYNCCNCCNCCETCKFNLQQIILTSCWYPHTEIKIYDDCLIIWIVRI